MTLTINLAPQEHSPAVWPLRRMARCDVVSISHKDDFVSLDNCDLMLDRGNAEFGLLFPLDPSTSLMVQYNDDKPVHFKASDALAVCSRSWRWQGGDVMKVCVLLISYQIDLLFGDVVDAHGFLAALTVLAMDALVVCEPPGMHVFMKDSFRITQLAAYRALPNHGLATPADAMAEMSRLWKAEDISDFVVVSEKKRFNVHRAVLSLRSDFFRNACKPGFIEGTAGSIHLEEDAATVEVLLMEIYGVKNNITGSVFATFALEPTIKKEAALHTLLSLFVAADKYDLEAIKLRTAGAILDRLPFILDCSLILDLANITLENFPVRNCGLCGNIIRQVQARLPMIMSSSETEGELMDNALMCSAVLRSFADMVKERALVIQTKSSSSASVSPSKKRKFY